MHLVGSESSIRLWKLEIEEIDRDEKKTKDIGDDHNDLIGGMEISSSQSRELTVTHFIRLQLLGSRLIVGMMPSPMAAGILAISSSS